MHKANKYGADIVNHANQSKTLLCTWIKFLHEARSDKKEEHTLNKECSSLSRKQE